MQKQDNNKVDNQPSKYSRLLANYNRSQFQSIISLLMVISQNSKYGNRYPIFKLLKVMAKTFLLNEIEGIFLAYFIKQTDWNIKERLLSMNAENVRDILSYSIEGSEYKCLILYLMACAYTVKYYLNDDHSWCKVESAKICPNFQMIFESWVKKHLTITARINVTTLNRVYKELYHQQRTQAIDFNMIVDAIIQISPAYNPEREKLTNHQVELKKQPTHKITPKQYQKQYPIFQYKQNQYLKKANLDMNPFSRVDSMHQQSIPIPQVDKNQSLRDSSILFPRNDSKRQTLEIEDIKLNEEQSQNMIFVGIKRGQSLTDKCLEDYNANNNSTK